MSAATDGSMHITIAEAINRALGDAMADEDKVVMLGEDIADPELGGIGGLTRGLSSRFGEKRVRSTPISEQAIIGAAIGASLVGYRPVAEIMLMNFTTVAMDMIVNHAAKLRYMSGGQTNVPIVIRTMTGAGFSSGGQHADYFEAWFAHVPGMTVVAPSSPSDAYGLIRSAIDSPDPVMVIENMPIYMTKGDEPASGHRVPLGKASILAEGTDLTIVTYSRTAKETLIALQDITNAGVSAEVIDLRSIQPWDKEAVVASVAKTGRCLIAHEAVVPFGAGAEIAAFVSKALFGHLKAPVERIGAPFAPVPFAKSLEMAFITDAKKIAAAAIGLVKG